MKRSPNSISRLFTWHQMLSVFLIMLFFLADSLFLYYVEHESAITERSYQLQIAANEGNVRMRVAEESIKETLTTVMYNYDGLWSDEDGLKYFDKQKLNRLITNKKMLISELDSYFAFRPEDITVFQTSESDDIFQRLAVKEYLMENAARLMTTVKQNSWQLCTIRDTVYLVIIYYYSYADIYVGAAVKPEALFAELFDLADTFEGNFQLTSVQGEVSRYASQSGNAFGHVDLPALTLEGDLTLDSTFTVGSLQVLQGNLVGVTVIGFLLCILILVYTNVMTHKELVRPIETISTAVEEMDDLTEKRRVPETARVAELRTLERALNTLLEDAVFNRMKLYDSALEKKEQELRMLRAQLRPHFFLNAISTVSSMTYQDRNEDIRDYLMKLSRFLRYTISSTSDVSLLKEEIENIDNYLEMQQIRYPGRVVPFITSCEAAAMVSLPRFLLLTIVENSFKYAMRTDDVMQIFIECRPVAQADFSGVVVSVEDNGGGFSEEQLAEYNRPEAASHEDVPHIGITNVKRTLALYYGQSGLLRLSNAVPSGARVELWIPREKKRGDEYDGADRG